MSEPQEQANIIPEENPIPEIIPLMPIREAVYFPHAIFPIFVGRDKSVRALEEARCQDRYILLVAQQEILETLGARERLEKLSVILKKETEILEIQKNIRNKVEKEMGETQREFILREQLKAIQQELGERDERGSEIEEYRGKIAEAKMPEEAQERALKELDRLEKMPFQAPEGVVVRTYLDWMVAVPWTEKG